MSLLEVAEYLQATRAIIYKIVKERKIPAFRVGSYWRLRRSDLEAWIAQQQREMGSGGAGASRRIEAGQAAAEKVDVAPSMGLRH